MLARSMVQPCGRDKPNFRDMNNYLYSAKNGRTSFFLIGAILHDIWEVLS
jgi:hypothetical protein